MENKSFEQLVENYTRQIRETRGKILEDFYLAYCSHLAQKDDFNMDDVCLVEWQCEGSNSMNRKYWFEHRPKFEE
jgi:hypothetical protein